MIWILLLIIYSIISKSIVNKTCWKKSLMNVYAIKMSLDYQDIWPASFFYKKNQNTKTKTKPKNKNKINMNIIMQSSRHIVSSFHKSSLTCLHNKYQFHFSAITIHLTKTLHCSFGLIKENNDIQIASLTWTLHPFWKQWLFNRKIDYVLNIQDCSKAS